LEGIIGSSFKMRKCYERVSQATDWEINVLITRETGTGKELFAKALHRNSVRAKNNFEIVDCTVIPETLVESLLFGYEKGAFTGADAPREGLIQRADRGTLFLDEVGELPLTIHKNF
jgi:two-component system, NtrC family, response regulator